MIVKLQLTVFLWFYSPQAVTKNSALRCPGVGIALAVAVLEGGGGPDTNFGVLGGRDGHADESLTMLALTWMESRRSLARVMFATEMTVICTATSMMMKTAMMKCHGGPTLCGVHFGALALGWPWTV